MIGENPYQYDEKIPTKRNLPYGSIAKPARSEADEAVEFRAEKKYLIRVAIGVAAICLCIGFLYHRFSSRKHYTSVSVQEDVAGFDPNKVLIA